MVNEQNELDIETGADDSDEPPWSATMTVGNTSYAVSLFWQPLQDPDDPIPEIKETAEGILEGADVYCLRSGNAPQYGLGLSEEGHRPSQIAAAISLADAFSDQASSVSVFEVPEGWWFLAIRNDLILSEEDVLYLNEDDAQRAFFSMMAVPDWGRKIAPASWGIDGTTEMDIETVLRNTKQIKLQKLGGLKGTKFLVVVGGAGLVVAWILYKIVASLLGWDTEVKTTGPLLAPPPPIVNIPVVKEEKKIEKKAWESLPITEDVLNYCWEGIMHLKSLSIPGWRFSETVCNAMGVSVAWDRDWGRIAWLKKALDEYNINFASKVIAPEGNRFIGSLPLTSIKYTPSPPNLTSREIREELNDIFQGIGQNITLQEAESQTEVVRGIERKKEISDPAISFSFQSKFDPPLWSSILTKFSGLEITQIRYLINSNEWKYEGKIYERSQ